MVYLSLVSSVLPWDSLWWLGTREPSLYRTGPDATRHSPGRHDNGHILEHRCPVSGGTGSAERVSAYVGKRGSSVLPPFQLQW